MIDFHCHLLHGIDDGSRSLETSINILRKSGEQGVRKIVATPHFYASEMSIDRFLSKRQEAYEELIEELCRRGLCITGDGGLPELMLGAEVAFFDHMADSERIADLTIRGTDVIMVEMPFVDWEESHLREIEKLASDYTVIVAHIERFINRRNKKRIRELTEMTWNLPIKIQVNAEAFENRKLKRNLVRMFNDGKAHMLGSDCHGMNRRPPNLPTGMDVLRKELGDAFIDSMNECNEKVLRRL